MKRPRRAVRRARSNPPGRRTSRSAAGALPRSRPRRRLEPVTLRLTVDHQQVARWRRADGDGARSTQRQAHAGRRRSTRTRPPRQYRYRGTRAHIVGARGREAIRSHPSKSPEAASRGSDYNPGASFCPGLPEKRLHAIREGVPGRAEAEGGICEAVAGDVSRADDVAAVVDACVAAFGRIDVLHNNVGIVEVGGPAETTEESWDRVNDVNLKSMFLTRTRSCRV